LDNLQELELKFGYFRLKKPVPASVFRFSSTLLVVDFGKYSLSDSTVKDSISLCLRSLDLALSKFRSAHCTT
jgi:hypothetical protein